MTTTLEVTRASKYSGSAMDVRIWMKTDEDWAQPKKLGAVSNGGVTIIPKVSALAKLKFDLVGGPAAAYLDLAKRRVDRTPVLTTALLTAQQGPDRVRLHVQLDSCGGPVVTDLEDGTVYDNDCCCTIV